MSRYPKRPGKGFRLPEPGNDIDLGRYEGRLRQQTPPNVGSDQYGLEGVVEEIEGVPLPEEFKPTGEEQVDHLINRTNWQDLLPPNVDWFHQEVLMPPTDTATEVQLFTLRVPRSQSFIILEFTPICLSDEPGGTGLFIEEARYRFFGRIYAEIQVSGRSPIRASAHNVSAAGAVLSSIRGTSTMNERAFVADPNYPMAFYAGSEQIVSVNFKFRDLTGAAEQVQNIPGVGTNLNIGMKLLGFFIPNISIPKLQFTGGIGGGGGGGTSTVGSGKVGGTSTIGSK